MVASGQIACDLNCVAAFLAANDFPGEALTPETLQATIGVPVADVLVLLGNSVLQVAQSAFAAMHTGVARRLMISGGRGHSTGFLYEALAAHPKYKDIETRSRGEADLLAEVASSFYQLDRESILLEIRIVQLRRECAVHVSSCA